MPAPTLITYDVAPKRFVGVAVQLWNPVTLLPVSDGLTVTLQGRTGNPVVNRSDHFVWLGQEDVWPSAVSVDPGTASFEPIVDFNLIPQRPALWPNVPPASRLIRVPLTPTADYPFAGEVVVLRGDLHEVDGSTPPKYPPIAGAEVWLEWWDLGIADWRAPDETLHVRTNKKGHFAAFLRIARDASLEPDRTNGFLKIRVAVVREGTRRFTPEDFAYLPDPAPAGRIPEDEYAGLRASLDWAALA